MNFNSLPLFSAFDRRLERLVSEGLSPRARRGVLLLLLLLLLLTTWLHYRLNASGAQMLDVHLYYIPVVIACLFFGGRGAWIILICLGLYNGVLALTGGFALAPWGDNLIRNFVHLGTWSFLAIFTTVTMSKFRQTRRYQMLIQQDVAMARTLQRALMPRFFESPRVRVDARIHQTMQIGGDFYYFRPFKEKYVVYALGDIMGKGIPASMVMAIVMGFFYEWGKQSFSPSFILERLNERLYSMWTEDESWFVTMFYAIYDEESRELVYSSGGHQAALLLRGDGSLEYLKVDNLPVGVFEAIEWEEKRVALRPGDRVVVFTDGVNEARNPAGEIFTMERLIELLQSVRHETPTEIARAVVRQVRAFAGGGELTDDLAVMVMQVKE